jgi:serine/threonine-protein kinase HipA
MKKIQVTYAGWGEQWPLGTLAEDGTALLFEYSSAALARGLELSPRHLKLRAAAYGDFPAHQLGLPGLIADSLPDGWGRLLMDRHFKKSLGKEAYQVTPLERLAFMGSRAMGALTFAPPTDRELQPQEQALLALAQDIDNVVHDRDHSALLQLALVGGSPQGARPKALVQYHPLTGLMSTLESAGGTPWLVKFPARGEHADVCVVEHVYAELARLCGIDMPRTRYFLLPGGLAAFAIERFDRANGQRVPMHTLAGALHVNFQLPSVDYQSLLRMTRWMTRSETEVLKAFERCVFNVVFNNRDDHTKNFSYLLSARGHWQLAPGYDLTYCEGPRGEHQMAVEGEGRHPGRAHLLQLAHQAGLPQAPCLEVLARVTAHAARFDALAREHPVREDTRRTISRAIAANVARVSPVGGR